ncbi:MAG: hypothetical protein LBT47_10135 [Deltaproteobacteria bacterium]|jgi:hypothetical protein|nr:hypothetical protein [Deltaproteobacteria bacterium]
MKLFKKTFLTAATAIFLVFFGRLAYGESWGTVSINQSQAPVRFKISRPSSWQLELMDGPNEVSRGFFKFDRKISLDRGLIVTGTVPTEPDYDQSVNDVAAFSSDELIQLAKIVMATTLAPRNPVLSELTLVDTVKIKDLTGLRIRFNNSYMIKTDTFFNIHEVVMVLYKNKTNTAKSIIIDCTYTGSNYDKLNIINIFNSEYSSICQRFYSSLSILDIKN